jgi:N-acetylglutamate synthase-like GNAT family acetyltransferase/8-oxo-dGTP pyrophosphatase MutT (NUDIX family)
LYIRPQLSSIRARFGYPYHLWLTYEFDESGWNQVQKSILQKRAYDVTLLIEGPDGRFALLNDHNSPPGFRRSPSSGIKPGEDFLTAAMREAKEETGLNFNLKRFLLHVTLDINRNENEATWDSYVFHAVTQDSIQKETKQGGETLRWVGREQMKAVIQSLKETGNSGLVFRAETMSSALWALDNDLSFREATERDLPSIGNSLLANRIEGTVRVDDTFWWIPEVRGLSAGTVGVTPREDCAEMTGLTVDPIFRGRGLGHTLVEYACDQWRDAEKRKKIARGKGSFLTDKLWLITQTPGYFLPVNFVMTEKELLPKSLKERLIGPRAKWTGMRHQLYKF